MGIKDLNHGFGPVFARRSSRDYMLVYISMFLFALLICSVAYHTDGRVTDFKLLNEESGLPGFDMIGYFCCLISALILGEFLKKITFFAEEFFHISGRYNGSYTKALSACLYNEKEQKPLLLTMFIGTSIATVYYWKSEQPKISVCLYFCIAILGSFGMKLFGSTYLSKVEISELNEKRNINVADGLAWSYYFGYLKFVLEDFNKTIEQSVGENHKVGEEDMRDVISRKKLFIVISKTCNGYKSFDQGDPNVQCVGNLHSLHKTRGGVQQRTYKNTLYKISHKNREPIYIALEYATPLLSMFDMQTDKHRPYTHFTEEDLNDQVVEFFIKIKEILERDDACRGKYQLVLCNDVGSNLSETIYQWFDDPSIDIA